MAKADLPQNIAKNITELRRDCGMTQAGLAEKLGYSDKSVSKWERAEGIPDVLCLKAMADLFGVTVDYFLEAEHEPAPAQEPAADAEAGNAPKPEAEYEISRGTITLLAVAGVWLLAAAVSLIVYLCGRTFLLPFAIAVPVSALLLVIFNALWGRRSWHFFTVTALVLGILFLICWITREYRPWALMLLGIPAAAVVALACRVRVRKPAEPPEKPDGEE